MRKLGFIFVLLIVGAIAANAAGPRTLTQTLSADSVEKIKLDSGVGDVEIVGRDGDSDVIIDVVLIPRRGGFFSSKRQAEREVEAASLFADVDGNRLVLRIDPESDDRRFEEHWTIAIPSQVFVKIDHDVGNIEIRGVAGGLDIDSGVGDVLVRVEEGDVSIDLGVGTAVVKGIADAYGSAEGSGGVGHARLSVDGEQISGEGFVSHSAVWEGTGLARIEVEVGVGDAVINLK
jgi:hypothetical protein